MRMSSRAAHDPVLNITALCNAEQLPALRQQTSSHPEAFILHPLMVTLSWGRSCSNARLGVLQEPLRLDNSASPLPAVMQKQSATFLYSSRSSCFPAAQSVLSAPPPLPRCYVY